jgi:hypothetical protein
MKLAEREANEMGAPRPVYGFAPQDVAEIVTDDSARVFFRLHDGLIFDTQGELAGATLPVRSGALYRPTLRPVSGRAVCVAR